MYRAQRSTSEYQPKNTVSDYKQPPIQQQPQSNSKLPIQQQYTYQTISKNYNDNLISFGPTRSRVSDAPLPSSEKKPVRATTYYDFNNAQSQVVQPIQQSPLIINQQTTQQKVIEGQLKSTFNDNISANTTAQSGFPQIKTIDQQATLVQQGSQKQLTQSPMQSTKIIVNNLEGSPVAGTFKVRKNVTPPKEVLEKLQGQGQIQSSLLSPARPQNTDLSVSTYKNKQSLIQLNKVELSPSRNLQRTPPRQNLRSSSIGPKSSMISNIHSVIDSPSRQNARKHSQQKQIKNSVHLKKIEGLSKEMERLNKQYIEEEKQALEELLEQKAFLEEQNQEQTEKIISLSVRVQDLEKQLQLKTSQESTFNLIREDKDKKIQQLDKEILEVHNNYQSQIDNLKAQNEEEKSIIKQSYDEAITNAINREKSLFDFEVKEIEKKFNASQDELTIRLQQEERNNEILREKLQKQSEEISQQNKQIIELNQDAQHVRNLTSENQTLKSQLSQSYQNIAQIENSCKNAEKDYVIQKSIAEETEAKYQQCETRLAAYNEENKKLLSQISQLQKLNEDYNLQITQLRSVSIENENLETQLRNTQEIVIRKDRELSDYKNEFSQIDIQSSTLRQEYEALEQRYRNLEQSNIDHIEELKLLHNSKIEQEINLNMHEAQISHQRETLQLKSQLQDQTDKYQVIEQQFTDLQQQNKLLLEQVANQSNQIEQCKQYELDYQKLSQEYKNLEQNFQFFKEKTENQHMEINELVSNNGQNQVKVGQLESELIVIKDQKHAADQTVTKLMDQNNSLVQQLDQFNKISTDYEIISSQNQSLEKQNMNLQNQVIIMEKEIANLNIIKSQHNEIATQYNILQQDMKSNISQNLDKDNKYEVLLRENRDQITQIEKLRQQQLYLDGKNQEAESDVKGLIQENDRLNQILNVQRNEIESLKIGQTQELTGKIKELEAKLIFYINENDKLNKILHTRNQSGSKHL